QKEREGEQLQQQRSEAAKVRRAQQQCKARLIQERRVARAEARVAKAKEKANQAAKRAQKKRSQKAEKLLQSRIKLAKKDAKQGSKHPRKPIKKKKQVAEAVSSGEGSGAASPPPPIVLFLSGLAHITLPERTSLNASHDELGGADGLVLALDVAGTGHVTTYPSDEPTVSVQLPLAGSEGVPAHRVLGAGPCAGEGQVVGG
ncbi:hypothetical protein B0A49_13663, partial [Cryomyces minteri]